MKVLRKILLVMFAAAIVTVFASADEGGFTVSSYDINMTVNDDNSYKVTETIVVRFSEQRHGIYRSIPLKLESGKEAKVKATVASKKYKTYEEDGNYVIKIGDEDSYAASVETYVIDYTFEAGYDYDDMKDKLYFNLIGVEPGAAIEKVSFRITMPYEFDEQLVKFYSGYFGRMTDNVEYTVRSLTIEGSIPNGLIAYEALTVEIILPEGYYVNAAYKVSIADRISAIAPLLVVLFLLAAVFIWRRFCMNPKPDYEVRSFPPDGCNPADAAYVLNGAVTGKNITSLFTFWASKGYVMLEAGDRDNGLVLKKRMEMGNERKAYERNLFNSIFRTSDKVDLSRETTEFSKAIQAAAKGALEYWQTRQDSNIFMSGGRKFLLSLILCFPAMVCALIYGANGIWQGAMSMFVSVVVCIFIALGLIVLMYIEGLMSPDYGKRRPKAGIICGALTALIAIIVMFALGMGGLASLCILASLAVTFFLGTKSWNAIKRTEYGNHMLLLVMGFKDFIEFGDRDQIRDLCDKYAEYYYDNLAFAMSFGLEKKWTDHFKSYYSRPPQWYEDDGFYSDPITPVIFYSSYCHRAARMHSVVTGEASAAQESSDSGSSGFSGGAGGGSGGGGVGSW